MHGPKKHTIQLDRKKSPGMIIQRTKKYIILTFEHHIFPIVDTVKISDETIFNRNIQGTSKKQFLS